MHATILNDTTLYFQMEAKMAFAKLFQTYKISLPEEYELVPVLRTTLQPKDDIYCTVESRH